MNDHSFDSFLERKYRTNCPSVDVESAWLHLRARAAEHEEKRRRSASRSGLTLRKAIPLAVAVILVLVALGFGVEALLKSGGSDKGVTVITDGSMSPSGSGSVSSSTTELAPLEPTEVVRLSGGENLWQAWLNGESVLWMQSKGPVTSSALHYSNSDDWDTIFRYRYFWSDKAQDAPLHIPGPKVPAGARSVSLSIPPCWAALLPSVDPKNLDLVFAMPPQETSDNFLFHGLYRWSTTGKETELLPFSQLSLQPQRSGDAIAIPVPSASYRVGRADANDPRFWDKLLMMTANMEKPVEVDPAAPKLPEAALQGLSPYFSLLTVSAQGKGSVSIFDLRTGEKLPLELPAPPQPSPAVAGHFATWYDEKGDVYLADLESGESEQVLSLETLKYELPAVALSGDWLVALRVHPSSSWDPQKSPPSDHPGADLVAIHLPDLERIEVSDVLKKGEIGSVQVSGDKVLLKVSPAIELIPHNEPDWVALRIVSLDSLLTAGSTTEGDSPRTSPTGTSLGQEANIGEPEALGGESTTTIATQVSLAITQDEAVQIARDYIAHKSPVVPTTAAPNQPVTTQAQPSLFPLRHRADMEDK